jgi:hypothetical protein
MAPVRMRATVARVTRLKSVMRVGDTSGNVSKRQESPGLANFDSERC